MPDIERMRLIISVLLFKFCVVMILARQKYEKSSETQRYFVTLYSRIDKNVMLTYLRHLFQLILSPGRGWEDVSASVPDPDELQRRGLYPLLGIAAMTEFVQRLYVSGLELSLMLERAIVVFGAYFASVFVARLLLELTLPRVVDGELNLRKCSVVTVCIIGLMVLIQILSNVLPSELTMLRFMPLLVVVTIYKAAKYLCVKADSIVNYLLVMTVATIITPLLLYYILYLIIA